MTKIRIPQSEQPTTTLSTTERGTIRSISLSGEKWKQAKGYSSNYYVSNMGRLLTTRHHGAYRVAIMKPGSDKDGHLRTVMNGKTIKVHRVVAQTWIPNPENLPVVNHLDSDPANNKIENLEWTTWSGNSQHAYAKGRLSDSLKKAQKANPSYLRLSEQKTHEIWDWYQDECRQIPANANRYGRTGRYQRMRERFPELSVVSLRTVVQKRRKSQWWKSYQRRHTMG